MREFKDTGYYVTSDGNVIGKKGRKMNTRLRSGYDSICVYFTSTDYKNIPVHRMVAETYIPNPNNLTEINHINGIKTDNRVSNLEWSSKSHNMRHALRTDLKGRLTSTQRQQIRKEYVKGSRTHGGTALGKKYGVHSSNITRLINDKSYNY